MLSAKRPLARRKAMAAVAASAAAALLVASCSGQDPNASPETTRLVVAYTNETTTIDPARADYVQTNGVAMSLYDTLVTYDQDSQLIGSLATEFAYNESVDAIDITLRDDVTFHDGTPFTSSDVQWSLDRYKDLGIGIFGQIASYDSTEIVSDYELTISLKEPDALFMGALSRIYILNSALVEQNMGDDGGQSWLLNNDAGSGPYTFGSEESGTYTLQRFDDYWNFDENRPQELIMRRIDDLATT